MPNSLRELDRLGVRLDGGFEFAGIHSASRRDNRGHLASGGFGSGKGIGIRRVDLHRQLVDHAEAIGVRLRWGAHVSLREGLQITVAGEPHRYRYLVGADGESSRVRRWAGLDRGSLRSERFGFRRHYRMSPWKTDGESMVEVHWGELGQAYVTPVAADEICVAAITRHRGLRFEDILEGIPGLSERLIGKVIAGLDRGGVTTTRKLRHVTRGNIALVGDASGSTDAITGEGLASVFREALLLGEALSRDAIEDYEAGHADILRLPQAMGSAMLAMDRWHWLRERVMRVFANDSELFVGLLAVHIAEKSPVDFAKSHGWRFGTRFLMPDTNDASRDSASHASRGRKIRPGRTVIETAQD